MAATRCARPSPTPGATGESSPGRWSSTAAPASSAGRARFYPQDGDGLLPTSTLTWTLTRNAKTTLRLYDASGGSCGPSGRDASSGPAPTAGPGTGGSRMARSRRRDGTRRDSRSPRRWARVVLARPVWAGAFAVTPVGHDREAGPDADGRASRRSSRWRTKPVVTFKQPGKAAVSVTATRRADGSYLASFRVRAGPRGTATRPDRREGHGRRRQPRRRSRSGSRRDRRHRRERRERGRSRVRPGRPVHSSRMTSEQDPGTTTGTGDAEQAPAGAGTWVILPTYNEAENLPGIAAAILESLPGATLLVVDDGSPDGTGELADGLADRRRARAGEAPAGQAGPRSCLSRRLRRGARWRRDARSSRWTPTGRTTRRRCPA